jgi:hypothetical protein
MWKAVHVFLFSSFSNVLWGMQSKTASLLNIPKDVIGAKINLLKLVSCYKRGVDPDAIGAQEQHSC